MKNIDGYTLKNINKLASSVDAIAISEIWKHYPLTDWEISKKNTQRNRFLWKRINQNPPWTCVSPTPGQAGSSQQEIEFSNGRSDFSRIFFKTFQSLIVLIIITLINLELIIFSILTIDSLTILMISNSDYHCYNSMTIIMISSGDNWSAVAVVAPTLDVDPRVTVLCARLHYLVIMV